MIFLYFFNIASFLDLQIILIFFHPSKAAIFWKSSSLCFFSDSTITRVSISRLSQQLCSLFPVFNLDRWLVVIWQDGWRPLKSISGFHLTVEFVLFLHSFQLIFFRSIFPDASSRREKVTTLLLASAVTSATSSRSLPDADVRMLPYKPSTSPGTGEKQDQ